MLRFAPFAVLTGCLLNGELYEQRRSALTDHDGDGWTADAGDCDEASVTVHPGADEHCDGVDEDCDGTADDDPVDSVWLQDGDGDGWGGVARSTCWPTAEDVAQGADCDDTRADVHPGAAEACDAADVDEDCDGFADQDDPDAAEGASTWYIDDDADGHGSATDTITACESPEGYVADDRDCDDSDPDVHPGAQEVCSNGVDDDCDGTPGDCALSGDVTPAEADAFISGWGNGDLGSSLAFVGDMDGDGREDLAVSAMELPVAGGQGAVFLFSEPTGSLDTTGASAQLTGEAEGDRAGERIAGVGDVDGDAWPDLVVAAPGRGGAAGAVYVVHGPLSGTSSLGTARTVLLGEMADDGLGLGLGAAGDVDGDGFADVLVTAYGSDGGGADAGAAWLLWGGPDGTADALVNPRPTRNPGHPPGGLTGPLRLSA